MTILSRTRLASLLAASLAAAMPILLGAGPAQAQAKPAAAQPAGTAEAPQPGKEVALTQELVDGLVAAQVELAKLPGGQSDPKAVKRLEARAEAIAKKNGFASLAELQDASDSVDTVLAGIDPETGSYVGAAPLLEKQLAAVRADKTLSAKEKAVAVKEFEGAIAASKSVSPSEANIALVTKNFAKLSQAVSGGDGQKQK
ncbi:hypothetical protein [Methylorubrum zatmanii]|uniref:DUF4142 domain-containing protein n=1 Tax=Methylorubrum zatmanii TaxID=29429 RepID=A0ABW1WUD2_9HYPH|nr:hypothetical protein [Methylorubrum zatmanii]MBD8906464.1 hypothetical protein [Methylorubrum zatmanii]